jgi:hypothetical protein
MKVLPHVMRNINEFNIPCSDPNGYEILYFGANLILMFEYRLSFDVKVKNSEEKIEVLIISRKHVPAWKTNANMQDVTICYKNSYAFILDNRTSSNEDSRTKNVDVTLVHTWQQEVKESQLKDREVIASKP